MSRASRAVRRSGARTWIVAAVALIGGMALPGPAQADRWGAPFRLAGPLPVDLLPAELAFAPTGQVAVGFGAQDEDNPSDSQALMVTRSARGQTGKVHTVSGAQQILDLAYDGSALKLLTASSPSGQSCCTTAQAVSLAGGHTSAQTISGAIFGATVGRLLVFARHVTVVALGSMNGVWVQRSPAAGGRAPGPARRLTAATDQPTTLTAAALSRGRSLVAWTANAGPAAPGPRALVVARGSQTSAPQSPRTALRVPANHEIDELDAAGGSQVKTGGPAEGTVAYVESWFDRAGAFHAQVAAADLKAPVRPRAFPIAGRLASGVSLASDARGDQVLAWKACDSFGGCRAEAVGRAAGRRFGAVTGLGAVDASESPVAAVAPNGEAVVGWVANGHVFAAEQPRPGARFAPVHRVSATNYATGLTLAFAPRGGALAAWTQGTLNSSVMAATLR